MAPKKPDEVPRHQDPLVNGAHLESDGEPVETSNVAVPPYVSSSIEAIFDDGPALHAYFLRNAGKYRSEYLTQEEFEELDRKSPARREATQQAATQ